MKINHLKAGISSLLLATGLTSQAQDRPNIVLFMVDDMGWQDTSEPFWKEKTPFNQIYQTPNMEKMAAQGMKFTQAYSCAVSSPTRVSLITGMNAARHRVTNWTLNYEQSTDGKDPQLQFPEWNVNGVQPTEGTPHAVVATTFPKILRDNGYTTIHCGKAHFGSIGTLGSDPLNLGFDINIAGHAAGGLASYQGLKNFGNDENGLPKSVWAVPGLSKYHGKDINITEALTLEAINAIEQNRSTGKPFFLYLAHYAVHIPLEPNNLFYQKYKDKGMDEREARYASMIEGMDKSLGDIMEYLKKNQLDKNTIIIFMSDNGGLAASSRGGVLHVQNAPLNSGKGSAYEGGIRVPMMVVWPKKVKPKSVCNDYLLIDDFFPSILEVAKIRNYSTVQPIDGVSFVPALKGKHISQNRALYWHFPNNWGPTGPGIGSTSTVRFGNFKLIYYHAQQQFELFDISNDIGETTNLAKAYPEKVKELAALLGTHLRAVNAQMPTNKRTGKPTPWPDELPQL